MTVHLLLSATNFEMMMHAKSLVNRPWLKLFGAKYKKTKCAWQHIYNSRFLIAEYFSIAQKMGGG